MKKYKICTLSSSMWSGNSMKTELSKEVELFVNQKVTEGFEIVSVSFSYFESRELVAFVTICK